MTNAAAHGARKPIINVETIRACTYVAAQNLFALVKYFLCVPPRCGRAGRRGR